MAFYTAAQRQRDEEEARRRRGLPRASATPVRTSAPTATRFDIQPVLPSRGGALPEPEPTPVPLQEPPALPVTWQSINAGFKPNFETAYQRASKNTDDPFEKFTTLTGITGLPAFRTLYSETDFIDRSTPVNRALRQMPHWERYEVLKQRFDPDLAAMLAFAVDGLPKVAGRSGEGLRQAFKGFGQTVASRILPGNIYGIPTPEVTAHGLGAAIGGIAGSFVAPPRPQNDAEAALEALAVFPLAGPGIQASRAVGAAFRLERTARAGVQGATLAQRLGGPVPAISGGASRLVPDLRPFQQALDDTFQPNRARIPFTSVMLPESRRAMQSLANMKFVGPVAKKAVSVLDPNVLADTPLAQGWYTRMALVDEGVQRANVGFSNLRQLGTEAEVFGAMTKTGVLKGGPFKGKTIHDVLERSQSTYAGQLTQRQQGWIARFRAMQDEVRDLLQRNGVEVAEADLADGAIYINRRLVGKIRPDGELEEMRFLGPGPGRPGTKTALEKARVFKTIDEAQQQGYVYLNPSEALYYNLRAAYKRVADQQFAGWVKANPQIKARTVKPSAVLIKEAEQAGQRRAMAEHAIDAIQRAKRGEQLPTATIKAINEVFPGIFPRLREASRITLSQLFEAGRKAARPEQFLPKATPRVVAALRKEINALEIRIAGAQNRMTARLAPDLVPHLQGELARLKRQEAFLRFRQGIAKRIEAEGFEKLPPRLQHQFTPEGQFISRQRAIALLREDQKVALDELLTAIRGKPQKVMGANGKAVTRYRGGLIDDIRAEERMAIQARKESAEQAGSTGFEEGRVQAPAFQGLILEAEDAAFLNQAIQRESNWSDALAFLNTLNTIPRFFALAGDASLFGIQLLASLYSHPIATLKAGGRFAEGVALSFANPLSQARAKRAHAAFLAKKQHVFDRYPGLITASRGTEATEAFRSRTLNPFESDLSATERLQAGVGVVVSPLKAFQNGYEFGMDAAGVYLAEALEGIARRPQDYATIAEFINQMRGLTSTQRLGVGSKQRQWETAALLAPRYARATAALMLGIAQGELKRRLARDAMLKLTAGLGITATALTVAKGAAEGRTPEQIQQDVIDVLNPASPDFLTWDVAGQRVGPGSKFRSYVKFITGLVTEPEKLVGDRLTNSIFRFYRVQAAGVPRLGMDWLIGENYLGEPNPEGLPQLTERWSKENLIPLWVQSTIFEGGSLGQRFTRGATEFFGGRAYPANLRDVRNMVAREQFGLDYDELGEDERYGAGFQKNVDSDRRVQQVFQRYDERYPVNEQTRRNVGFDIYGEAKAKGVANLRVALDAGLDGPALREAISRLKQDLFTVGRAAIGETERKGKKLSKDEYAIAYWSAQATIDPETLNVDFDARDEERRSIMAQAVAAGVSEDYILRGYRGANPYGDDVISKAIGEWDAFNQELEQVRYYDLWKVDPAFTRDLTPEQQQWYEEYRSARDKGTWIQSLGNKATEALRIVGIVDAYVNEQQATLRQTNPALDVGLVRYYDRIPQTLEGQLEKVRLANGTANQLYALVVPNKEGQFTSRLSQRQQAALVTAGITTLEQIAAMTVPQVWVLVNQSVPVGGQKTSLQELMRANWPRQAAAILKAMGLRDRDAAKDEGN